ncbi:MAG TPA: sugar-binding transcriptional regulator [Vicinamibacterales bacterium]|jgi:DNA-binding transcriptional regulator LsrR (DeoR family)
MARLDELRLLAKVARLYYRDGLRQVQITDRLNIHQSTVSRLLRRAEKEGIVRITLTMPSGLHPELEDALQSAYGLREAIIVETVDQEDQIVRDLGAAAAFYLETTLKARDVVGISSWSGALLAMVESMHPNPRAAGAHVVQILGGIGNPSAELHATQLTRRLANLLGDAATLLPAPGAVGSADARRVMVKDRYVQEAMALFKSISIALVGIGAVTPSKMLAASGNVFSAKELKSLSDRGAVGDICLRFFDANGAPVVTPLNDRVIAIELSELTRVDRVVGIAGGRRKFTAIRGALRGRRINVLITDRNTAERLVRSATAESRHDREVALLAGTSEETRE